MPETLVKTQPLQNRGHEQYQKVLDVIRRYDASFLSSGFSVYGMRIVRNLRRTGVLTDAVINAEIEKGIVSRATEAYEHAIRSRHLDHTGDEALLAYVLVRHPNLFADNQIKLLESRLDHGMSMNDFKNEYYKPNFVENLKNKLFAPLPDPAKQPKPERIYDCC